MVVASAAFPSHHPSKATLSMNQPPEGQDPQDYEYTETVIVQEDEEPRRDGYWHKMGGGSLTISVIVHGIFVIIALLIIWRPSFNGEDPPPEFLPGGGGGGGGGEQLALKKQRSVSHAQPS